MISVISVVMKARSRRYPIKRPLMAPSATPQTRVAATTAGTGQSSTLRQNSEQMVWPVTVSQTKKCVLHRRPEGEGGILMDSVGASRRAAMRGRRSPVGAEMIYFLRPLRFQQAVSLAAFSL